jgi:glycerol-3-phosphate acyltransferase PlsY
LVAIAGHSFPLYIGFRGGRGVSTSLGAAIGLAWLPAIISFVVFGIVLGITRYVSLGSICAAIAFPVFCWLINVEQSIFWFSLAVCILLIYKHIPNMKRLATGAEPKVGQKVGSRKF